MAKLHKFLHMLPVAVTWFSSDGIAIHYVLSVLQMMPCFYTMAPMGRQTWCCVVCHVAVPVGIATDQAQATASHCLIGSAARLAGQPEMHHPGHVCRSRSVLAV